MDKKEIIINCVCGREIRFKYSLNEEELEGIKLPDPYLQPGWPCEVWDYAEPRELCYFSIYKRGKIYFCASKRDVGGAFIQYDHYRPVGTEWDFAPWWAKSLCIDESGYVFFLEHGGNRAPYIKRELETKIKTVLPEKYCNSSICKPRWA